MYKTYNATNDELEKIKKSIIVQHDLNDTTLVVVLAIDKKPANNFKKAIASHGGMPLGGHVYDTIMESIIVKCVDYLSLGYVNFSLRMKLKNILNWQQYIPIPDVLLLEKLSPQQLRDLELFKQSFKDKKFKFIQFKGCY